MQINNRFIKIIFKLIITLLILESIYLFAIPPVVNNLLAKESVQKYLNKNLNASLDYKSAKFKTHVKPYVSLELESLIIQDKDESYTFLDVEKPYIALSLPELLKRQLYLKTLKAQDFNLYLFQDSDGVFNFEKLFPRKNKSAFKPVLKNNLTDIKKYSIKLRDDKLDKELLLEGSPLKFDIEHKENLTVSSKGILSSGSKTGEFDINLTTKLPVAKTIDTNSLEGKFFVYHIDLSLLKPYLKKYVDKELKTLSGYLDYLQLSTSKTEDDKNEVVINSLLKDVEYDRDSWVNHVVAKGDNSLNAHILLDKNVVKVDSFSFKAKDVNIKSSGKIKFVGKKPELDLNAQVIKSKAENIAAILPPNLVPRYMTIEKVKKYGVWADVDCNLDIKGSIPQPDITGYVKAKNVRVLDNSIHHLHKGSVDINFDKRILNMDILVNLFDNQQAKINGSVHMYRDGINDVTVKTTDKIDFPLAQKIVVPVSKVFNFQLGPIPEMDIKTGKGIIDINIKGNMDFVNINGYSSFYDASLYYNGLFGKVEKGSGELNFKNDVISFKSKQAFVKTNPLNVHGSVKINDNLDFTVSSTHANAKDVLEIINKSTLLKDVKEGLAIITGADGTLGLNVNMKANIVPVPFGHPPLPPEEAFKDMKVKGNVYLLGNSCFIEGFKTPIEQIKGIVDFTESVVDLNSIVGISGTSPVSISGNIVNDLETKIPEVDVTITSKEVKLKDTIRFLTKSYLYPENYPDLSGLYNIASKHDLYFKYKAKSKDFETAKAYAVMNFIPDKTDSAIKAKSGRVIMEKANVKVEDIQASLYDSDVLITGNVLHVDRVNPEYNIKINTDSFNLQNLNDTSKIDIMPENIRNILKQFSGYKGVADINLGIDKSIINGNLYIKNMGMNHSKTNTPFNFDNFNIYFKDNKILINNMTGQIADMPVFADITIANYMTNPSISGYFTSKLTNSVVKTFMDAKMAEKFDMQGDVGLSSKINATMGNIAIEPKLILNPEADVVYGGINIGDVNEKREFSGKIRFAHDLIFMDDLKYIKYISSQNNKTYPIVFANASGKMQVSSNKVFEPVEFQIKTNKNLPARILNILLKTPMLKQGTFSCDLKYKADLINKTASVTGEMDSRNLDIPLFDTIVKHVRLKADKDKINLALFGFMADSKINITSEIQNNLMVKPHINSLRIYADRIDRSKMFESMSSVHNAMNTNNKIKNVDLTSLSISNGHIEVKELLVKSMIAQNCTADFSIDEKGVFTANNMKLDIGQGNMQGRISYNLADTALTGDFELNDVDSNYIAETLFEGKNQIYGNANGKMYMKTKGTTDEERIKNLSGLIYFDISDGRMPKLGSLEYLLRASNILKSGITGFTINSILELLNLVKTGYFSNINGGCVIENGIAKDIEIFSKGENLSIYIHGTYDIAKTSAELEILGKLSKRISTIFGKVGNTSLNTFFKLIPGISMLDFGRKDFIQDVEKIPSFTGGDYESRIFQAIIDGNINESGYVQSFKWVK